LAEGFMSEIAQVSPSTQGSSEATGDSSLHFGLIEMAFALALAEIGMRVGDFADGVFEGVRDASDPQNIPFYSYLILATLLIACSWIGWGNVRRRTKGDVETVFSWGFVELLIDLLLVVLYFVLIHVASPPDLNGRADYSNHLFAITSIVTSIFVVYCLWDVVSKSRLGMSVVLQRMTSTLVSLGLCLAWSTLTVWGGFVDWGKVSKDPWYVLCVDGGFIALVLLFRALKMEGQWSFLGLRTWRCLWNPRVIFTFGLFTVSVTAILYRVMVLHPGR
jgi:hypothetical protein